MRESLEHKVLRVLYAVLFYLIFSITDIVLLVITVIQSALHLLTGEPSQTLRQFGANMALYLKQITDYLSHASEQKPFPFSDWPESQDSSQDL